MAGYIVKVMIENTHPPVWRRIVLPEKITFKDLHQILQIAFNWSGYHLHDFSFPQTDYRIVQSKEDLGYGGGYGDLETNALIDDLLKDNSWIRYTYDFGDDWQHKIKFEGEDSSYIERYAQVIKWKGDNFNEDTGGVYGAYYMEKLAQGRHDADGGEYDGEYDDEYDDKFDDEYMELRNPFSLDDTNRRLKALTFQTSKKKNKKNSGKTAKKNSISSFSSPAERIAMEKFFDAFLKQMEKAMASDDNHGFSASALPAKASPSAMTRMAEKWQNFASALEDEAEKLHSQTGGKGIIRADSFEKFTHGVQSEEHTHGAGSEEHTHGVQSEGSAHGVQSEEPSHEVEGESSKKGMRKSQSKRESNGNSESNSNKESNGNCNSNSESNSESNSNNNSKRKSEALSELARQSEASENYEQLILPGFEMPEMSDNGKKAGPSSGSALVIGKYTVVFEEGTRTVCENLEKLSVKQIRDYCKYLRLPYENETKECLAASFSEEIKKHPEYLLLCLNREETACLQTLLGDPDRRFSMMNSNAITAAIVTGLAECRTRNSKNEVKAVITFAEDARDLFDRAVKSADLDEYYTKLEELDRNVDLILMAYGLMEIEELFNHCRRHAGCKDLLRDFERYVYLHLRFPDTVKTFTDENGTAYVARNGIDIDFAMMLREHCAGALSYSRMTKKLYESWKDGIFAVYPEWEQLAMFLEIISPENNSKNNELMIELSGTYFDMVANGCTATELCEKISHEFSVENPVHLVLLWEAAAAAVMNTGLAGLKGHSRSSYLSKKSSSVSDELLYYYEYLPLNQIDGLEEEEITEETHLYELCDELALLLFAALSENPQAADELDAIIAETNDCNPELRIFNALKDLDMTTDPALLENMVLQPPGGHVSKGKIVSITREMPKIYPNDPCPCGSGKKYKKCCGKEKSNK